MFRRETRALDGRCLRRAGEILSSPEAMDLREEMARLSSVILNLFVRT